MTIKSKPATRQYRDGWERVYKKQQTIATVVRGVPHPALIGMSAVLGVGKK
jgi:hypothetical protein